MSSEKLPHTRIKIALREALESHPLWPDRAALAALLGTSPRMIGIYTGATPRLPLCETLQEWAVTLSSNELLQATMPEGTVAVLAGSDAIAALRSDLNATRAELVEFRAAYDRLSRWLDEVNQRGNAEHEFHKEFRSRRKGER